MIKRTSCDLAALFANLPGFAKLNAFGLRSAKHVSPWKKSIERRVADLQSASSSLLGPYEAYSFALP